MHPLKYYIWGTNARKQGYNYGCIFRSRFMVDSTKEGWNLTEFVNDCVGEIIKDDKARAEGEIKKLQDQIDKNNVEIKKFEERKDMELSEIKDKYKEELRDSELKKAEIELNFKKISSEIVGNMTQANTIINGLVEKIKKYANDSEKYWNNQTEKIGEEWKKFSVNLKKIVSNDIKSILVYGIDTEVLEPDNRTYRKDFGALLFLLLICIYDFWFGYEAISQRLVLHPVIIGLLAFGFVPLVIWSIHYAFLASGLKVTNKKWLGHLAIIFVIVIVLFYVGQSLPVSVKNQLPISQWMIKMLGGAGLTTIFRLFMVPSMIIGEVVIETTNWDNIAHYLSKIGKKFSVITHLVRNGLTALKMRSLSKWLKEEKKIISENIDNIKSESTPDFSMIKQDITQIQSLINPIYDSQAGSKGVYERNLEEVNREIQNLKNRYDEKVAKINNKFAEETSEMREIVDTNKKMINNYNKQLSELESDTRGGFLRGLRGK